VAWAYNSDYQNPPIGGSQAFPRWLETKIDGATGSRILLSADVKEIFTEQGAFKGIRYVQRHKEYKAYSNYLIAACDVEQLYKNLLPEAKFSAPLLEKLKGSEMYSSSVTLSIALNCPAEDLGFGSELTLISNDSSSRDEHSGGDPHKAAISVLAPSVRDKTLCPPDKGTLTLYVPAWMNYENFWRTERKENGEFVRTEAYKALKEAYAQIILDRVSEKMCPNLREHIEFYEVATPITYYRYTRNREGTMMGTRPGKINMQNKIAHYKTPVKGVLVGGHWAELGGGVPIATKAAYNASLMVLKDLNRAKYDELVNLMERD
jgi:prolycopene isomerase